MKLFDLNILTEAELRNRPVYVFRKVDRAGESQYAFVKREGPQSTITFNPTGDSNLLFYTNREDAEHRLSKFDDSSVKLSIIPISQIRPIENKANKRPDQSGYVLFFRTPKGDDLGYQAIMPNGKYKYVVGKSREAHRNRVLKFDNPRDAAYFARYYFPDQEVAIRPVEGSPTT
jgi:hypothetical protein